MKSTSGHELLSFDEFDSERNKIKMNLNARDIVDVHISFRFSFCPFLRVRIGGRKLSIKIVQFWGIFYSQFAC